MNKILLRISLIFILSNNIYASKTSSMTTAIVPDAPSSIYLASEDEYSESEYKNSESEYKNLDEFIQKYPLTQIDDITQPNCIVHLKEVMIITAVEQIYYREDPDFSNLVIMIQNPDEYCSNQVHKILKKHSYLIEFSDMFGYKLIDYAILEKNHSAIKDLLKYTKNHCFNKNTVLDLTNLSLHRNTGKKYNQKQIDRLLYITATHGEHIFAELLLDLGANHDSKPFNNKSPLEIAEKKGKKNIFTQFLTKKFNSDEASSSSEYDSESEESSN